MKHSPHSYQHHDLYKKYHDHDSEIRELLRKCGSISPKRSKGFRVSQAITNIVNSGAIARPSVSQMGRALAHRVHACLRRFVPNLTSLTV